LHLVGILFPHINDDAWSKSHQTYLSLLQINVHLKIHHFLVTKLWWYKQ